jgi:hypothetical protein
LFAIRRRVGISFTLEKLNIRLLVTGTLHKLIVPMMCSENKTKIVLYGLKIFKNLTTIKENNENAQLMAGVNILINLYKDDSSYYKITKLCIVAIGNLCKQKDILEEINRKDDQLSSKIDKHGVSGGIFETMLNKHLEDADSKTQGAILKMFNFLTNVQAESMGDKVKEEILAKMKRLFFEKQLLNKIVACFVSLDKNVAIQSLSILM